MSSDPQPNIVPPALAAQQWDARFAGEEFFYGKSPNDFLVEQRELFPAGARVLLLGEGEGRNACFLARHGCRVTAVDASAVGLGKARALAAEQGVSIETIVADLNEWHLAEGAWDGIVSIWCHLPPALRGRVHAEAVRGLAPGGVFLLEAYTPRQLEFRTGGPPEVRLLVTAADARAELEGLDLVRVSEHDRDVAEGVGHRGRSAVLQVIARRPA